MDKRDRKDGPVEALLWTLTALSAGLDFAGRHRRWAPALALLLGVLLARRSNREQAGK